MRLPAIIFGLLLLSPRLECQVDEYDKFFETKLLGVSTQHRADIERKLDLFDHVGYLDRQHARDEILKLGRASVPVLVDALAQASQSKVRNICFILSFLDDPKGRERLIALLEDPARKDDQVFAVHALGKLREGRASDLVRPLLAKKSRPLLARWAALALGSLGDPASIPDLKRSLEGAQTLPKMSILLALGRIGDPAAFATIKPWLSENDDRIRTAAALAAADLRCEAAIADLLRLLSDEHAEVARMALLGLALLDVPGLGQAIAGRRSSIIRDERVHERALVALGAQRGEGIDETIAELTTTPGGTLHPSERVRAAAAFAFGLRPGQKAERAILAALGDQHPRVREAALLASALPPAKAVGAGEPLLADRDAGVRSTAALVLAYMLGKDADPILSRAQSAATEKGTKERIGEIREILRDLDRGGRSLLRARVQVAIDDRGGSPEWNLLAALNAMVLKISEVDGPFPPIGGGTPPTGTGPRPPVQRFSAEEEDLRVWLDARPYFDRRSRYDVP